MSGPPEIRSESSMFGVKTYRFIGDRAGLVR
jgi:hypothetical protein